MSARGAAALLTVAAGLALPAAASAQPPSGIVRPDDEQALSSLELGEQLFAGNCSVCHGIGGRGIRVARLGTGGIRGRGPSLRGVGALAADFYLRTGYMPLGRPEQQPSRRRPLFREREIRALTTYVASLERGPAIPRPEPGRGRLSEGLRLFTEHCAGCHQVVTQGGVVTGAKVPPLEDATAVQVAEAVRIGPYLMPRFSKTQISDDELNSIIAYVELSRHPVDRGGWGLGNIGPVPEGMVTWLLATVAFLVFCMVIGKWQRS